MELRQLETFVCVARRRSFTRAAEELHLTQPAVTRQIAALEAELKTPLFDRLGKSVPLTAAGEMLLRYAERILRLTKDAQEAVSEVGVGASGRLSVGASTTLAAYVLPGVLTQFRASHPGVELAIRTGVSAHIVGLVQAGTVDLGLVTNDGESGLAAEPLGAFTTVLVVMPGHPLAVRSEVAVAELAQEPLLLMEPGTNLRSFVDQLFAQAGATLLPAMELDSVETIKRMVEAGLGISLLPQFAVAAEVAEGKLVARPLPEATQHPRHITLVWRPDKFRTAAMESFVAFLRSGERDAGGE